jgi:sec-independent protein translocase protein TatA
MPNVGAPELVIVLIIALIVFGPKRLPELGRSLGRGIREFRGSISGDRDDSETPDEDASREPDSQREIEPPQPSVEEAGDSEPATPDRR